MELRHPNSPVISQYWLWWGRTVVIYYRHYIIVGVNVQFKHWIWPFWIVHLHLFISFSTAFVWSDHLRSTNQLSKYILEGPEKREMKNDTLDIGLCHHYRNPIILGRRKAWFFRLIGFYVTILDHRNLLLYLLNCYFTTKEDKNITTQNEKKKM